MIFEKDGLVFDLLDVIFLKQGRVVSFNGGRNFDALSYRFRAKTVLRDKAGEHFVQDGSLCFVPANVEYVRDSEWDELAVVHFRAANYSSSCIEAFMPENRERTEELFRRILAVWNEKKAGYRYRATALFYEIFAECYAQNVKSSLHNSKIEAAVRYLEKHFKEPSLTIGEIAGQSFMSEVYFRKLFKAEFGTSPQKYVVRLRVNHAASLMAAGYYSLKEVAALSGFSDYKYFATEFKRQKGVSPSQYRYNYNG